MTKTKHRLKIGLIIGSGVVLLALLLWGGITIVLDSRTDVLKIPASAGSTINGEEIVYYPNEEGMKAYKPVKTGMRAGDMIEVISGLTEGESIILR